MDNTTDFMATWRSLRQQCDHGDAGRRKQICQQMQFLLEQYGAELRQAELNECVADVAAAEAVLSAAVTSATGHRRSQSPIRS